MARLLRYPFTLLLSVFTLSLFPLIGFAASMDQSNFKVLVQIPYEPPPPPEFPDIPDATPAPSELSQKEQERLESLVPLLEGRQELWAIGEFVHFGKHSVPYLVKALKMPGTRLRYNAIETLSLIKDPSVVPSLLEVALDANEMSRVRTHAIRTATRLDSTQVVTAIGTLVKDPNSTIRNAAVFEARKVRQKEILPIIIGTIPDPEQYVSITARDSFWSLTGFSGTTHDWETSTPEDREAWVKEWWAWWEENKGKFGPADSEKESPKAPSHLGVS